MEVKKKAQTYWEDHMCPPGSARLNTTYQATFTVKVTLVVVFSFVVVVNVFVTVIVPLDKAARAAP